MTHTEESEIVPGDIPKWYRCLSASFRKFHAKKFLVDVIFYCQDNQQVVGHQIILSIVSPYFKQLLLSSNRDDDDMVHVLIPEISAVHLQVFIDSIYRGLVPTEQEKFKEWKSLVSLFQIFPSSDVEQNTENQTSRDRIEDGDKSFEAIKPDSETQALIDQATATASGDDFNPIQIVQTDRGDMVIIPWEENFTIPPKAKPDDSKFKTTIEELDNPNEVKTNQDKICPVCSKAAIEHRVQLNNPGSNPSHKLVYRCCKQNCKEGNIKTAKFFNIHMTRHETYPIFSSKAIKVCPLCHKSKLSHKNKNQEVLESRSYKKGSLYKCCLCKASKLGGEKKFFEHVENHISKKFVCQTCNKGYSYQHLLQTHQYKEHGEGQMDKLTCPIENCQFETKYRQTLDTHVKEKHQGKKKTNTSQGQEGKRDSNQTVTCPTCKKELKKWYYQQFHRKTCSVGTVLHQCQHCGQEGFVNKVTLNNHIRAKHSENRPFQCEYCPSKYATAMSLSGHRARKHNLNKAGDFVPKKLFPCGLCGRLLTSRTKVLNHVKAIHDGEKSFKCPHCSKKFSSKSNMKIHEGVVHTGLLPYKCDKCDKMFSRKQLLKSHLETNHEVEGSSGDKGQFSTSVAMEDESKEFFIVEVGPEGEQLTVSDIIMN